MRVPNAWIGMAVVLFTEATLFAGLVAAHLVLRSRFAVWPPWGQPRLPVEMTGVFTALLVGSGWALLTGRTRLAFALGAGFLAGQGSEWVSLLGFGLTTASSVYGALFYTLVGAHGLHVLAGLGALAWALAARPGREGLGAVRMYWSFVVAIWPPLYGLVYLW